MEVENKKVTKPSAEARATAKSDYMVIVSKNEFERLIGKLDSILERFDGIVTELEMTNHICRIPIELVGGVDPGRKNLTSLGSTIAYTYGDANRKDKLTAYNGKAITYDAIGNP